MPRPDVPRNPAAGWRKADLSNHCCLRFEQSGGSDQIGSIRTKGIVQATDILRGDGHREAALERCKTVHLPPPIKTSTACAYRRQISSLVRQAVRTQNC